MVFIPIKMEKLGIYAIKMEKFGIYAIKMEKLGVVKVVNPLILYSTAQVRTPQGRASVAAGVVNFEQKQPAKVEDVYPWGSALVAAGLVGAEGWGWMMGLVGLMDGEGLGKSTDILRFDQIQLMPNLFPLPPIVRLAAAGTGVTKMFTAATIMKMVAAGRFRTWAADNFFQPVGDGSRVKPPTLTFLAPRFERTWVCLKIRCL